MKKNQKLLKHSADGLNFYSLRTPTWALLGQKWTSPNVERFRRNELNSGRPAGENFEGNRKLSGLKQPPSDLIFTLFQGLEASEASGKLESVFMIILGYLKTIGFRDRVRRTE